LNGPPELKLGKVAYPKSETMTFLDEKVPVFQKPFRLTQGRDRRQIGEGRIRA